MTTALVTEEEARQAREWITLWAKDYHGEVPMRIHSTQHGQHFGLGSSPPFAPEFLDYIGRLNCARPNCKSCREDLPVYLEGESYRDRHYGTRRDERTRVTRAFRKLRRAAPLEHDVLRMAVVYGLTLDEIAERLNARAEARGFADRYDRTSVTLLAILGTDKVAAWI